MSLQLSLLFIGLVIIAAVVLSSYDKARLNKRYSAGSRQSTAGSGLVRKAISSVESRFRSRSRLDINPGPLAGGKKKFISADAAAAGTKKYSAKIDPFIEDLESFEQAASMPLDSGADLDDFAEAANGAPPDTGGQVRPAMPDEMVDFIISLPGRGPVMRNEALGVYKQNEYLMEKPRRLYGRRYIEKVWTNLDYDNENAKYGDMCLALQLVDAAGPIGESELTAFAQLGLKLADALKRPAKHAMSFEQAMQRASELDRFCRDFDVIASISLLPQRSEGFRGQDLRQAAIGAGMRFGAMNIFHMKNDEAPACRHMFSMANLYEPGEFAPDTLDTTQVQGLTLFMHVPCCCQPEQVFDKMVATARQLSRALDGRMYDQDKRPLTDKGISIIRTQIDDLAAAMAAEGVVPGSERALRLFQV